MRPFALVALLLLAACTPGPSATPEPSLSPSPGPSLHIDPGPSESASPSSSPAVVIDPTLRDVLPETVDSLEIVESPEAEAASLEDPGLATFASALYAGLAVDSQTNEFIYAVVIRLREGEMGDERFRDYRDSFDEGACSQASGVVGHAQTDIEGRTVYIGTCAGGVRTYHVWLAEQNLLVSASAVGEERRLGETLVEGLRP
jgi:hypothetical protein